MRKQKLCRPVIQVFFAVLITLSFFSTPVKSEIIDRVVAVVNKDIITLSELLSAAQSQTDNPVSFTSPEKYRELLQSIIEQKLISMEALQKEIKVSDKEVDQFVDNFKERNGITTAQLKEAVQQQGMSWEEYRKQLREEIMRNQIIAQEVRSQVSVTESDFEKYYQNHLDDFIEPPRVRIEQMFFPFPPGATPEAKAETISRAEEAYKRIKSGDDFQKIAVEYNLAKENGSSDLGYFNKGELMAPLEDAAFNVAIGGISRVISVEKGCFIIRVLDRLDVKTKSIEEVQDELYNKIYRQKMEKKFKEWIEELHNNAYIEIKI